MAFYHVPFHPFNLCFHLLDVKILINIWAIFLPVSPYISDFVNVYSITFRLDGLFDANEKWFFFKLVRVIVNWFYSSFSLESLPTTGFAKWGLPKVIKISTRLLALS